ncbi:response regulator [Leptolyngbya ohadii]|uniref:response regulator n=1 Tax=Leptolyngbya ohadii TaxID=1962290 RepID=UPI000B5A05E5|nr:response regulator [Leptolyngbya ohadii]
MSMKRDRILLIEDNLYNRELMRDYLQTCLNLNVLAVADGREALANLSDFQPDLILLDLKLPHLDGFAVLEELNRRSLQIPVFVITACTQSADRERAMSLGAVRYFVKPTCLKEICQAIEIILEYPLACEAPISAYPYRIPKLR